MKISKSTQRRVIALFVLVCLLSLPNLILSVLHVVIDKDWRTTDITFRLVFWPSGFQKNKMP